jgi:pilus assembly protein FimV
MTRAIQGRLLASLWLLLLPLQALALSMGDLVVQSVPGVPLRAHIPLTLMAGESLPELRITLATPEEYAQRHLPRAGVLQGLRLALLDKGEGQTRLQLFGEQPWQGEAAQLLFIISSAGQPLHQMERQYQLAAVTSDAAGAPLYVEVAKNATLDEIAITLSKGRNRSYLHMMYALFLANPDAFYRGNMNNLKSGSRLRVPSAAELYRLSDGEVFDGIRQQYAQWLQLRESTAQHATPAGEALAGMSNEQAAGLDLSANPDALRQRLQQVAAESEAMRQENEVLQQRLKALEQRMQSVAGQVLEYADSGAPVAAPPVSSPRAAATTTPQTTPAAAKGEEGLPASAMFAAIVLVLLFVFYIWYTTGHPRRGRP